MPRYSASGGGDRLLHHRSHPRARLADARFAVREQREVVRGRRVAGRCGRARAGNNSSAFFVCPSATLHLPALISAISGVLYSGSRSTCSNSGIASRARPVRAQVGSPSLRGSRSRSARARSPAGNSPRPWRLAEHRVDEAVDVVELRVRGIERLRRTELLERHVHLPALVVAGGELGADHRALLRRRFLRLDRRRVGRRRRWRASTRLRRAAGERERGQRRTGTAAGRFMRDRRRAKGDSARGGDGMRVARRRLRAVLHLARRAGRRRRRCRRRASCARSRRCRRPAAPAANARMRSRGLVAKLACRETD